MPVHPRTDAANALNGRVPLGFGNLHRSPGSRKVSSTVAKSNADAICDVASADRSMS